MKVAILSRLCCAVCRSSLAWHPFRQSGDEDIQDGVAWCSSCRNWYPIDDGLLELLPPALAYREDRRRFWDARRDDLQALHLDAPRDEGAAAPSVAAQRKQQEHFDWYAGNDTQTYSAYEGMPFWKAVDDQVFSDWRRQVEPGGWLLDVGCAQGRSTFPFMDLPLQIVGFDVSKALVRQAMTQYRQGSHRADATFFVGDASCLPFAPGSFDYVLIYGVLHHLPDPAATCRDVARVLRPGGLYFGCENNRTIFRGLFDLLMKLNPIWHEEAGAEPLISAREFSRWFADGPVRVECDTRVFTPPHLVNWLGKLWGTRLLRYTDRVGRLLPFIRKSGGLIMVRGRRLPAHAAGLTVASSAAIRRRSSSGTETLAPRT